MYFNSSHLNHGSKLFSFVKMIMVLSHGQATVERGFSIKKEVEVENLKQENIVAQRTEVYGIFGKSKRVEKN